jgi:hypothetical protein
MTTFAARIKRLLTPTHEEEDMKLSRRSNGRSNGQGEPLRSIPFELTSTERKNGQIIVASGERTRNRDYWTGKPLRIDPNGVRLDAWRRNNLTLYMHNMGIPLGTADIELIDGKLIADNLKFHRKVIPLAGWDVGEFDTGVIADLWEEGFLNATSIHVILTPEDERNIVETEEEIFLPTSEMIEFSIVTIPGDRESVRQEFLDRGVCNSVACLLSPSHEVGTPSREVTMSVPNVEMEAEVEEEEIEETEVAEVEQQEEIEEEEVEMVLDVVEFAQALAASPEALHILAHAMAGNEETRAMFAPAIAEVETPQQLRQKFTLKLVADQPGIQAPAAEPPVQQRRAVQASLEQQQPTPAAAKPKDRRAALALGLVK